MGMKRISYAQRDHEAIVADVIERLRLIYPNKWNDAYEDSLGMMLVEAMAYMLDILNFYLDRQANETYLPTATERQNIINLCKLVGYTARNAVPASVVLSFSIDEAHETPVLIRQGTQVTTNAGTIFELTEDVTIAAGQLSATGAAVQGETFEELLGVSDGTPNQTHAASRAGVIKIISVTVAGYEWEAVDSVLDYNESGRVYIAELDADGNAIVSFGDGVHGRIPGDGEKITIKYRVGSGTAGNVLAETITIMRDIAADSNGNRVTVSVTNLVPASGGAEAESAEHIRSWAPRYFETQERCVTQSDYETTAMMFRDEDVGAIAKARAVVHERSGEANVIRYYVLAYAEDPNELALASQPLKDALLAYVNRRKMLTDYVEIQDGTWRLIDVAGTLRITPGFGANATIERVKAALRYLLNAGNTRMGGKLRISDVYAAIDNTEGVDNVELETPAGTVAADPNEALLFGNMEFSVEGSVSDGTNN
jgi:uncharacterized phage protein gp47/JayE